ncbi:MAG: MFS transporter [Caulobacterales bacterium]|jgi:MFS family permease
MRALGGVQKERDFAIPIALGCVAAGGGAIGLSFPLLALNLDDWGVSETGIGLFTLAAALSTVIATPFIPGLLGRIGTRQALAWALSSVALAFVGYWLFPSIAAWVVCRFIAGAAFSVLFVSCEAWALERAPPEKRGLIMGAFASTFAGAMAGGGALIALLGHVGPLPFLMGAGIAGLGLLLLVLPAKAPSAPHGASARPQALLARIAAAPVVMLAPLAMGAIETAKYNLIPIFARRVELGDEIGAMMVTAAGLGVLVMQPFLGMLADRIGVRPALSLCALVGIGAPLTIAAAGNAPLLVLGLMFAYSGIVTGLYTVGLVWLARRFQGAELAAGNAAFALSYGVGQVLGPALAGAAFGSFGPWGFMIALASMPAMYLAAIVLTRARAA